MKEKVNSIPEERRAMAYRLREIRESAGYTQEYFSEILGITPSAYKKIESAENQITIEGLRKIKQHFKVSADYLIFGETVEFNDSWSTILNSSDSDKMRIMIKLLVYFTEVKGEAFLDKKDIRQIDKVIEQIMSGIQNK